MKKLFLIVLASLSFNVSVAQPRDVKKIINKYDIKKYYKNATVDKMSFWQIMVRNNKRCKEIVNGLEKKKETLYQAMAVVDAWMAQPVYDDYAYDHDSLTRVLSDELGLQLLTKDRPIRIINDSELNASMDAYGQMRINSRCLTTFTHKELLAVCAHETAHYMFQHVLSRVWKSAKKEKINREWAKIGVSLAVGAMASTSMYGGSAGLDMSFMNDMIAKSNIFYQSAFNYADRASLRYKYRYNREEESEADIAAFRFMELMGYGGEHVISMLRKIANLYGDHPTGDYDDHPSFAFRIQVLTAMLNGYEGK